MFISWYFLIGLVVVLIFCGSGLFNEKYIILSILFIFFFWPLALIIVVLVTIACLIYKIFYGGKDV